MSNLHFNLSDEFYNQFLTQLEKAKEVVDNTFSKLTGASNPNFLDDIPTSDQMQTLIETAFWASIERDEGRPLQFNVSYSTGFDPDLTLLLEEPKLYNVKTLSKMAPIAHSFNQSILVNPIDDALKIRGVNVIRNRFFGLTPFTIKVLAPGNLVIEFCSLNLAYISGHHVSFIKQHRLLWDAPFWKIFNPKGSDDIEELKFLNLKRETVLNILREMRSMQHGGALIIVPETWETPADVTDQTLIRDDAAVGEGFLYRRAVELYEQMRKNEDSPEVCVKRRALQIFEKTLSNLSAVDGAVIINENLKIISYGAKLNSEGELNIVTTTPLEEETQPPISIAELGGTRHQSMARFIMSHREVTAFVVSQDGYVSAVACEQNDEGNDYLKVYKNLELTFY